MSNRDRAGTLLDSAIGGYFGLDWQLAASTSPLEGALLFQSERAALLALLRSERPRALWVPWFLCDSMTEAPRQAGIPLKHYALGPDFRPQLPDVVASDEMILCVNYFGVGDLVEAEMAERFPASQLIFDHAHALFAPRQAGAATLCSPRKFVGVPDGGGLWTDARVDLPSLVDTDSLQRAQGLLQRTAADAESGYAAYLSAEQGLSGQEPRRMSVFTRRVLASLDYAAIQQARRRNFAHVHAALERHNRLELRPAPGAVPLSYPFWPRRPIDRVHLHRLRVFVPCYWPELLGVSALPALERAWVAELLPLPIDHRYDEETLELRVIQPLLAMLAAG